MSTLYNGIAPNVRFPAPVAISSSTNTNPIKVFATAHGLTTGDTARIYGHETNTNANGSWEVNVVDANSFIIPSPGNGVGAATGFVQSLAPGVPWPQPSDGDADDAAAFNPAYEGLGDKSAMLTLAAPGLKMVTQIPDGAGAASGTFSAATWAKGTDSAGTTATRMTNASGGTLVLPLLATNSGLQNNDVVHVVFTATATSSIGGWVECWGANDFPGVTSPPTKIIGASKQVAGGGGLTDISFDVWVPIVAAGTFTPYLYMAGASAGALIDLIGDWSLNLELWRSTNVPQ